MKTCNILSTRYFLFVLALCLGIGGCQESFLDEKPLDRFSPENLLTSKAGFESVLVALHKSARDERTLEMEELERVVCL